MDSDIDILPRLPLVALTPYNMGNSQVESLASYIVRLARVHDTTEKAVHHFAMRSKCVISAPDTPTEVGLGLARALARDTGNADVARLGLGRFARQIAFAHCIRRPMHWCPECLADMQPAERYVPLVWLADGYSVCTTHQKSLVQACALCNGKVVKVAHLMRGTCCTCGADLSKRERHQLHILTSFDVAVSVAIARFVEQAWSVEDLCHGAADISRLLSALRRKDPHDFQRRLRFADVDPEQLERHIKMSTAIPLPKLAVVCATAGVAVLGVLLPEFWDESLWSSFFTRYERVSRPCYTIDDREVLRSLVNRWREVNPGLDVAAVSRRLRLSIAGMQKVLGAEWLAQLEPDDPEVDDEVELESELEGESA